MVIIERETILKDETTESNFKKIFVQTKFFDRIKNRR